MDEKSPFSAAPWLWQSAMVVAERGYERQSAVKLLVRLSVANGAPQLAVSQVSFAVVIVSLTI